MSPQIKKILKGAAIAGAGAVLTYLTEAITGADFGPWTAVVVAGFSVVVNALRYVLAAWAAAPVVAFLLLAPPAKAANIASDWSWGPTMPMFTVRFDSIGEHGGVHGGVLNAGAGVTLNRNFLPNADGSVKQLTLGLPIFASFTGGDPSTFSLAAGATLGTFNNLVSLGAAVKFFDVAPGRLPAGLIDGLDRTDVIVLISFGLNLGGGEPRPLKAGLFEALRPRDPSPPPGYVKLW